MATERDLEVLDSVLLAVMCKKLSQDSSADPKDREQALEFKNEWIRLTEREGPPSSKKELEKIQKEIAVLRSRMVKFLAPFV
jgi:hypothetical protein